MENRKKSCPNGLAQLCGLAQFYRLFKTLSTIFLLTKKNMERNHMNPWDGYIPLRLAHRLLPWYIQCSALSALLRGIYPSPGSAKQVKCDSNLWKSLAVEKGTSICGNPAGTVYASTRTSKDNIRAVRDARRATNDKRWIVISQKNGWDGHISLRRYGDLQTSLGYKWNSMEHSLIPYGI
jgi:hypothetical protein